MAKPSFMELIKTSELPVLVDFWADWCQPCHIIAPEVKKVAKEMKGKIRVVKLNVDENPQIAGQFGIRGIPTLILFYKGKPLWRQSGVMPAAAIKNAVEKAITNLN